MKCPKCQFEASDELRFCGKCGTPLPRPAGPFDPNKTETLSFSSGELTAGSLFAGRYLVIDMLGKGGMGCVYRALDTKVDEEVALKFINPEIAADARIVARFRTELKVTRKITHRHVCRMYDLGADGDALFITMEYIPGEDLADMVRRLGRLPVERAFIVAREVCEGLAEVHRLGIIHRDLKPKNIMIDRDGEAKIMDFGLARTPHAVKLTEVGHTVGTPSFMSPEQLNGEALDPRSDIFALGVIMYQMLTGRLPFEADSTLNLALQHKTHRPPHPRSLNPQISEELGRIVLKCLEIDKEERYSGTPGLLADLDKAGGEFDTYDVHVPGRSGKRAAVRPSRAPWAKIVAGTAIVLALAFSGLAIRSLLRRSHVNAERPPAVQAIEPKAPAPKNETAEAAASVPEKPATSVPVTFVTEPSRATIYVDDIEIGISDATFSLRPGRHAVRIKKTGYEDLTADLVAEANLAGGIRREFKLVPRPPAMGTLDVTSEPSEADVFLDGSPNAAGKTPFTTGLRPGTVRIRVSLAGYRDQAEDVELRPGERSALYCPLTPLDGTVEFSSDPEGADVTSGSDYIGKTPFKRQMKPGVYRFKIALKGAGEQEAVITVGPGETLAPLHFALRAPRKVQARYFLKVTSAPSGASVTLNGVLQKETTPFLWELDTGEVRIKVDKGGFRSREEVVVLHPAPARNEKSYELKRGDAGPE
jgi:tRNA A-37 threonylcarbamoyl transferase component Bud32